MLVTQITDISKTRCKVYLDYEFAFVLYKGELHMYHVVLDQPLSPEDYAQIMQQVLPKRAKIRAMNLLKSRDYTEYKLREKMRQGDYPENIIDQAIEYVKSYHYIDDNRYAGSYIRCYENSKSRKRINQDLLQKGITKDVIENAWLEWEEAGGLLDECDQIRKLLEKRKYDCENADVKEKQKTYAFLMRKGFDVAQIKKAMNADFTD